MKTQTTSQLRYIVFAVILHTTRTFLRYFLMRVNSTVVVKN